MTRVAYFDLVGGAAGDMLLCALLDAAASAGRADSVLAAIRTLPVDAAGVGTAAVLRHGIRALALVGAPPPVHVPTRTLAELLAVVETASLTARAAGRASRVFTRLAEAEAHVHGRPVPNIRLHEAGSDDAVVDIVGVCLALETLGIDRVECSPVPLGGRLHRGVRGDETPRMEDGDDHPPHGQDDAGEPGHDPGHPDHVRLASWPAPATAELLRGVAVSGPPPFGEATTPTGAALVAALAERFGPAPAMTLEAVGYGAGARDPADVANVVRVLVGRTSPPAAENAGESPGIAPDEPAHEHLVLLETNLDDLSPQHVADATEAIRAAGALDAWITPILMKKGRPGHVLSALVAPDRVAEVRRAFFLHTSTLGVREIPVERTALARRVDTVRVRGRSVRVKVGLLDGRVVTVTPEHDDVAMIAHETGAPSRIVFAEAAATWAERRGDDPATDPDRGDDPGPATDPHRADGSSRASSDRPTRAEDLP